MAMPVNTNHVYAIVLAAGSASRFGGGKQTAAWNGGTLVGRACQLAADCCGARTILVTGHDWQAVRCACKPLPGAFVVNENHAAGMGSSLALAVRCIRHTASAVLVMLADQPLVTTEHLSALVTAWSGDRNEIVASAYAETLGAPALFAAGCFADLCVLSGDQGARQVLQDPAYNVRGIRFEDAAADVDTTADLRRIARSARS
ncbi:MAG: nucleotidyltransferase family protein [Woeseiaceae bacterium]